jgi:hypothetical protein
MLCSFFQHRICLNPPYVSAYGSFQPHPPVVIFAGIANVFSTKLLLPRMRSSLVSRKPAS